MTSTIKGKAQSEQDNYPHEMGGLWNDYGLVFCNGLGRPIDARNLRKRSFADLLTRAGVKAVRFHDLRHTAATLLMASGVPVKAISEMLGHADISITLRVDSHVLPDTHEQAAATMDALFSHETETAPAP
jgi:integrase